MPGTGVRLARPAKVYPLRRARVVPRAVARQFRRQRLVPQALRPPVNLLRVAVRHAARCPPVRPPRKVLLVPDAAHSLWAAASLARLKAPARVVG